MYCVCPDATVHVLCTKSDELPFAWAALVQIYSMPPQLQYIREEAVRSKPKKVGVMVAIVWEWLRRLL